MTDLAVQEKVQRKPGTVSPVRARPARVADVGGWALAGAWTGLLLSLSPTLGAFSEVRNFQVFLLEVSYQLLGRVLPVAALRALATVWGEIAILAAIGALLGLAAGLIASAGLGAERGTRPLRVSVAVTGGLFVSLSSFLWCRIVFIHSNNARMLSWEGAAMTLASIGAGAIAGCLALAVLRGLARWKLDLAALACASLALAVGYFGLPGPSEGAPAPAVRQVVVLGGDGATWDIALPLLREGKLPNLRKLMERGSWGDIRTTLPWRSPILWTSMATGKRADEHGISGFTRRDPASGEMHPASLSFRKVKAVWDIATEAGKRVDVVNWYASWPAEPLNGTMISSRFVRRELADRVYPPERAAEIDKALSSVAPSNAPQDEAVAAELGVYLLERDRPDLHLVYLREIDDVQHFYWRYHSARRGSRLARWLYGPANREQLARKGDLIENAYRRLDAVLGRLLAHVGSETAVLVVSDHGAGIKSLGELRFNLNPVLAAWGYLTYAGDGKTIDWTRTRVFDSTRRYFLEERELYLNRRAEAPFEGAPSENEQRWLLEEVAGRLQALRTARGERMVVAADIRRGTDGLERLRARLNVRVKAEGEVSDGTIRLPLSDILWRTKLTGTHRMNGLVVMAGPGIRSGYRLRGASILDVTPTLLYLLGLPVGEDMDGRILIDAFEPSVLKGMPPRTVPTHEGGQPRSSERAGAKSVPDEELMEELRSLGYIQ